MPLTPKAESVDADGVGDGFVVPLAYKGQVLHGGFTRLLVSAPPDQVAAVHSALVGALTPPLKFLYVRMTDRQKGQLQQPEHMVAVELPQTRVLEVLQRYAPLIYHDGRNQIWVRGMCEGQVVLEEIGTLYVYPDDLLYRDCLDAIGVEERVHVSMADRDYVKVNFASEADELERKLIHELGLIPWKG